MNLNLLQTASRRPRTALVTVMAAAAGAIQLPRLMAGWPHAADQVLIQSPVGPVAKAVPQFIQTLPVIAKPHSTYYNPDTNFFLNNRLADWYAHRSLESGELMSQLLGQDLLVLAAGAGLLAGARYGLKRFFRARPMPARPTSGSELADRMIYLQKFVERLLPQKKRDLARWVATRQYNKISILLRNLSDEISEQIGVPNGFVDMAKINVEQKPGYQDALNLFIQAHISRVDELNGKTDADIAADPELQQLLQSAVEQLKLHFLTMQIHEALAKNEADPESGTGHENTGLQSALQDGKTWLKHKQVALALLELQIILNQVARQFSNKFSETKTFFGLLPKIQAELEGIFEDMQNPAANPLQNALMLIADEANRGNAANDPTEMKPLAGQTEFAHFFGFTTYGGEGSKYKSLNKNSLGAIPTPGGGFAVVLTDGAGGEGKEQQDDQADNSYKGGYAAGKAATEGLLTSLAENIDLSTALQSARDNIVSQRLDGLAAVAVAHVSPDKKIKVARVGDTQVLLIRKGEIIFRTVPQNVGWILHTGNPKVFSLKSAYTSPSSHIISYALGKTDAEQTPNLDPDAQLDAINRIFFDEIQGEDGDQLLLLGDGVIGNVSEYEILELAKEHSKEHSGVALSLAIRKLALERNNVPQDQEIILHLSQEQTVTKRPTRDNISAVVVSIGPVAMEMSTGQDQGEEGSQQDPLDDFTPPLPDEKTDGEDWLIDPDDTLELDLDEEPKTSIPQTFPATYEEWIQQNEGAVLSLNELRKELDEIIDDVGERGEFITQSQIKQFKADLQDLKRRVFLIATQNFTLSEALAHREMRDMIEQNYHFRARTRILLHYFEIILRKAKVGRDYSSGRF